MSHLSVPSQNVLARVSNVTDIIVPPDANRDEKYRLTRFADWMAETGRPWYAPDLAGYRDFLLSTGLQPSTVSALLSTTRWRYQRLLKDTGIRTELLSLAGEMVRHVGQVDSPANRKAVFDELIARIQSGVDPELSRVRVVTSQDVADSSGGRRLTKAQAEALLDAPGVGKLRGLRDTAIIAMLLATGIREAELCALEVRDLRQHLGGELALHIRKGKGCKERLVPYGELAWVLAIADRWLARAGIKAGAVFRGFYKPKNDGSIKIRKTALSTVAVEQIIGSYPLAMDGDDFVKIRPHDLRRTYARQLYEAAVDLVAIQQNLGHTDLKTTLLYIGSLDADKRRAPAVYSFDLSRLNGD